jgi:tripartite-type tricarboxylate transporter receptor subunit TctC
MGLMWSPTKQAFGIMLVCATTAAAQTFPAKTVRIVAPSPGGGGDFVARLIAQGLTPLLGQQVIVDNCSGGVIQGELVAKAAPDGHTLLISGSGLWLMPYLRSNVPFDPLRDFSPVTLAVNSPNVLVVHPTLPVWKSAAAARRNSPAG